MYYIQGQRLNSIVGPKLEWDILKNDILLQYAESFPPFSWSMQGVSLHSPGLCRKFPSILLEYAGSFPPFSYSMQKVSLHSPVLCRKFPSILLEYAKNFPPISWRMQEVSLHSPGICRKFPSNLLEYAGSFPPFSYSMQKVSLRFFWSSAVKKLPNFDGRKWVFQAYSKSVQGRYLENGQCALPIGPTAQDYCWLYSSIATIMYSISITVLIWVVVSGVPDKSSDLDPRFDLVFGYLIR